MERSAIVERGDPDTEWLEVATVPKLPDEFPTWELNVWQPLAIEMGGAKIEVQIALKNRIRGNPATCLVMIQHDVLFGRESTRLVVYSDGKSATIEQRQIICKRGPFGPGLEKRYCAE